MIELFRQLKSTAQRRFYSLRQRLQENSELKNQYVLENIYNLDTWKQLKTLS